MIGIICDVVKVTGGYEGSELKDRTLCLPAFSLTIICLVISEFLQITSTIPYSLPETFSKYSFSPSNLSCLP